MNLPAITRQLSGVHVGLSGAVPDREDLEDNQSGELDIRTMVSYLVDGVLKRGGRIVHGTHPTYLPIIRTVGRQFAAARHATAADKPVLMFLVGPYVTREEVDDLRLAHSDYACLEVVGPCLDATWSPLERQAHQAAWLQVMRERMVATIDALVCVGGKGVRPEVPRPGVGAEADLARLAGKPVYLSAAFGGWARQVQEQRLMSRLGDVPNGLTEAENAALAGSVDPSDVTELVLKGLTKVRGKAMENQRKHLDMIQAIVARLAGNSFLLKGWSVTLVTALFAFAAKDGRAYFVFLAYLPAITFWLLDGYYLSQERTFRALFDVVRRKDEGDIDFSMDPSQIPQPERGKLAWIRAVFSRTVLAFHMAVIVTIVIVMSCLVRAT
jgi:hypothetical protein